MNLDEFKAYIQAQRLASAQEAMSVLSAKINTNLAEKEKTK